MGTRIVFSASEDYFGAAEAEVRALAPDAEIERLGPGTGCLHAAGRDVADVAAACRHRPIAFVRHLAREAARVPLREPAEGATLIVEAVGSTVEREAAGSDVAVQVWADGVALGAGRLDDLRRRIGDRLERLGVTAVRSGSDRILSVCATPRGYVVGWTPRADALADWPGGRVRLAREPGQISRAEFKLEEAIEVFDLTLPPGGLALDLGASPGGWTRILRRHGLRVTAVDPGDLDPRIARDPGVRHERTTADRFLATTDVVFDVVVNDMRMVPDLSSRVMLRAAKRLRPGGLAVVTLKISPGDPVATVARCLRLLERSYEALRVRQLYHNRNEVTVVADGRERARRS